MKIYLFVLMALFVSPWALGQSTTITFETEDRHKITADFYQGPEGSQAILLCHQANYSRGEYIKTAPQLVEMGFTVLAIDQRAGDKVNGVVNETAKLAKSKRMPQDFIYTEPDIIAGIDYLFEKTGKPVIIVGSSYSASLALLQARKNRKVSKVAAFSPGEYYKHVKVGEELAGLSKPVFVTSSRKEAADVKILMKGVNASYVTQFTPTDEGKHGAKALWSNYEGSAAYWEAFKAFLKS